MPGRVARMRFGETREPLPPRPCALSASSPGAFAQPHLVNDRAGLFEPAGRGAAAAHAMARLLHRIEHDAVERLVEPSE